MLNINPERKNEGTVFGGGKVGERGGGQGGYTVSLPSTNMASIENKPHRSCVQTAMAREHTKAREHEVI